MQCQGAFNAIRKCSEGKLDVATTSTIIAPGKDWVRYLTHYIKTSANPNAAHAGLATAQTTASLSSCEVRYGQSLGCTRGKAAACKIA